jgi:cobalamin synthase
MFKQISRHFPHYFPLIGIFLAGIAGFIFFSYDRVFQMLVGICIAVSYVVWGLIHHFLHRDLYLAVVIEYIAVAILGLVVVFSLLFNV